LPKTAFKDDRSSKEGKPNDKRIRILREKQPPKPSMSPPSQPQTTQAEPSSSPSGEDPRLARGSYDDLHDARHEALARHDDLLLALRDLPVQHIVHPKTSYKTAYLLLFTLGWLGGHRYYLRRWLSALSYTFTFGWFGLGIALDIFLTFFMVREARAQEMGVKINLDEAPQALWQEDKKTSHLGLGLRLFLFVLWPPMLVLFAVGFHFTLIAFLILLLLLFSLLVGSIDGGLASAENMQQNPIIAQIPFLSTALSTIRSFQEHYQLHKPRSILYYLFFPFVGFPMMIVSKTARAEFRVYWGFFLLIAGGLATSMIASYSTFYPPYLGLADAAKYTFFALIMLLILSTSFTMPTVTTCFYLSLTNRQRMLRIAAGISFALSLGVLIQGLREHDNWLSPRGDQAIEAKLSLVRFRNDLRPSVEMFTRYYAPQLPLSYCARAGVTMNEEMTERLRLSLAGLFAYDERPALRVLYICPQAGRIRPWLGISVSTGIFGNHNATVLLYASHPEEGTLFSRWKELPQTIREHFQITNNKEEKHYRPDTLRHASLIDDWMQFPTR
jgi:TM2 domain-containing membrane protein YozV